MVHRNIFLYWWHVLRHKNGFWLVFHQVHHSPSRIEIATSFYKHPLDILSDAILSALVLYPPLGCSMMGAFWYNFSDIPLWDRLFGTYKDATDFSSRCGFPRGAEEKLGAMWVFKDVYREEST